MSTILVDALADTAAVAISVDKNPSDWEHYRYGPRYLKHRFDEIRSYLKTGVSSNPQERGLRSRTRRFALALGLAVTAFHYSPLDEPATATIGSETTKVLENPVAATALGTIAMASFVWLVHASGGALLNRRNRGDEPVFHSETVSEGDETEVGMLDRYRESLRWGTGVDVLLRRSRGEEVDSRYPYRSATLITAGNLAIYGVYAGLVEVVPGMDHPSVGIWLGLYAAAVLKDTSGGLPVAETTPPQV
jgi:hypothetical protein